MAECQDVARQLIAINRVFEKVSSTIRTQDFNAYFSDKLTHLERALQECNSFGKALKQAYLVVNVPTDHQDFEFNGWFSDQYRQMKKTLDFSEEVILLSHKLSNSKSKTIKKPKLQEFRGIYRSYSQEEKEGIVTRHLNGESMSGLSKKLRIPLKNIVRWCTDGYQKKPREPRARTYDKEMEFRLSAWVQQQKAKGKSVKAVEVQEKAKEFSSKQIFKASKGWLINFLKRNKLKL